MTKMLTATQQAGIEQGWKLKDAAEVMISYAAQQRFDNDEHMIHLVNLLSREIEAFDDAYNAVYAEHEAAEDAAAQSAKVVTIAPRIARRSRKAHQNRKRAAK